MLCVSAFSWGCPCARLSQTPVHLLTNCRLICLDYPITFYFMKWQPVFPCCKLLKPRRQVDCLSLVLPHFLRCPSSFFVEPKRQKKKQKKKTKHPTGVISFYSGSFWYYCWCDFNANAAVAQRNMSGVLCLAGHRSQDEVGNFPFLVNVRPGHSVGKN